MQTTTNATLTKRQLAKIDRLIETTYYRIGHGVQIDIMDISKIFAAGRVAYSGGQDLEAALLAAIAIYRKN